MIETVPATATTERKNKPTPKRWKQFLQGYNCCHPTNLIRIKAIAILLNENYLKC